MAAFVSEEIACERHQQTFIAVCFTHKSLLCTECLFDETHAKDCTKKSLASQLTASEKHFVETLKILQRAKTNLTETEKHVQDIQDMRQAVKGNINAELKDMVTTLNQCAQRLLDKVDFEAGKMVNVYSVFMQKVRGLQSKLEDKLSIEEGHLLTTTELKDMATVLEEYNKTRSDKTLECKFTVNKAFKAMFNGLKEIGNVIFVEAHHYEDMEPPKDAQNNSASAYSESVEYRKGLVPMSSDTGTKDKTKPETKGITEKKSKVLDNGNNKKFTKESPSFLKRIFEKKDKQIEMDKPRKRKTSSSVEEGSSDIYQEVTFCSPDVPENKTVVVSTKDGQQRKVSFTWSSKVKNGIVFYDELEQMILLTDTNGNSKCFHKIEEQPLALVSVSTERVTTLFVKDNACKMRCYDVSDTEIKFTYGAKLPDEFQDQFWGAWYDILNDKYAIACNGKLSILNEAGKVETDHELVKRKGNTVGKTNGIHAAYDFKKRLLFILDSCQKQWECHSIDKRQLLWAKTNVDEEFRPMNLCLTNDTIYISSGNLLIPISCEDGTPSGDPIDAEELVEDILACHFVESQTVMILTTKSDDALTSRTVGFLKLENLQ